MAMVGNSMINFAFRFLGLLLLLAGSGAAASGQRNDAVKEEREEYRFVALGRAERITASLGMADEATAARVTDCITGFYVGLHEIHRRRDERLATLPGKGAPGESASRAARILQKSDRKVGIHHRRFLDCLAKELDSLHIGRVKDGLTYGVLPATYAGYQEMLPDLTAAQKEKILAWLAEAREKAMDGGSSEEKHAWFGKYKGRINNFLSSEGYDLKKAGEEWEKRIREKSGNRKQGSQP